MGTKYTRNLSNNWILYPDNNNNLELVRNKGVTWPCIIIKPKEKQVIMRNDNGKKPSATITVDSLDSRKVYQAVVSNITGKLFTFTELESILDIALNKLPITSIGLGNEDIDKNKAITVNKEELKLIKNFENDFKQLGKTITYPSKQEMLKMEEGDKILIKGFNNRKGKNVYFIDTIDSHMDGNEWYLVKSLNTRLYSTKEQDIETDKQKLTIVCLIKNEKKEKKDRYHYDLFARVSLYIYIYI